MPRQPPRCPDCSSRDARPIVHGEPPLALEGAVKRGEVVLGGCVLGETDPAWQCAECGQRFGDREKPYKSVPARTPEQWTELVKTMLPQPVTVNEAGELLGGKPVTVIVRVTAGKLIIMEASWDWIDSHRAVPKGQPFATTPLRTPATRAAELIMMAWGKRLAQYRWCPRCQHSHEPEFTDGPLCSACAEKVLGTIH